MERKSTVNVVKTAQRADILKIMHKGKVVGAITIVDTATAELRDDRDKLIGTYGDADTAVAAFEDYRALDDFMVKL